MPGCMHMAAIAESTKLAGQMDPTKYFPMQAALRGWARDEQKKKNQTAGDQKKS